MLYLLPIYYILYFIGKFISKYKRKNNEYQFFKEHQIIYKRSI